jgi:hypothetical protein
MCKARPKNSHAVNLNVLENEVNMATVRELVVRFGFDVDDTPLQKMEEGIESIKAGLVAIGAAAVTAAAGLFGIAKSTADAADAIKDTSIAMGISYESLQRLGYAAQMSGANQEMLADGLRQLARAAIEAKDANSETAKAFKKLGVSAVDSAGQMKSPDALLMSLADGFKKMPAGVEKSALAMQFFGRSGAQLIQTLDNGSAGLKELGAEAASLGIIMDDAAIEAGAAFNDELDRLTGTAKGVLRTIGVGLIPIITNLMQTVRGWILANRELIKTRIQSFVQLLTKFLTQTWRVATAVWNVFRGMVTAIDNVTRSMGGFVSVLKVLAGTIGLFALGRLGMAIYDVAKGFIAISRAAILAWRSALLGPILIGAAIVGAFLIVEDFLAWLDGRPSVLGFILNNKDAILATLLGWFEKAKAFVYRILKKLTVGFLEFFGIPHDEAEAAFDAFATAVSKGMKLALEYMKPVFDFIVNMLGHALDGLILICQGVARAFVALATDPKQALSDFADLIGDTIKGAVLSLFDVVKDLANALFEMFGIDTSKLEGVWNVLEQIVSGVVDSIFSYIGKLRDAWLELFRGMVSAFTSLFQGDFLGFFEKMGMAIISLATRIVSSFFGLIKDGLKASVGKIAASLGFDLFGPDAPAQMNAASTISANPFGGVTPAATTSSVSNASSETTINAPITVTVPAGTDATGVAEAVKRAAAEEFNRMLRPAARATAGAVSY